VRIATLYDIHGNLDALGAALDAVHQSGADIVVVGGDVFPGPLAAEALDRLLTLDIPCRWIMGNGDRVVLDERRGAASDALPESVRPIVRWHAAALTIAHERAIASWPATLRLEIDGLGRVAFVHATPRSDTEIFTERTPAARLEPIFDAADADVVVCGHTHMQFDRMIGRTRVVNAGSVGMPFGDPGAHWALLGPEVELRRTPYDLEHAAARIRSSSYPGAAEHVKEYMLNRPSKQRMLDQYGKSSIGT
jgi:putative phosphoesterase